MASLYRHICEWYLVAILCIQNHYWKGGILLYFTLKVLDHLIGEGTRNCSFHVCVKYCNEDGKPRYMTANKVPYESLMALNGYDKLKVVFKPKYNSEENTIFLCMPDEDEKPFDLSHTITMDNMKDLIGPGLGFEKAIKMINYMKVHLECIQEDGVFAPFDCEIDDFRIFANMKVVKLEFYKPGVRIYVDPSNVIK